MPPLKESDASIVEALSTLLGGPETVARVLNPEALIRNIVTTVDNLPREIVVPRINPLLPVPGLPATTGKDATLALAQNNGVRYTMHVRLLESTDTAAIVGVYKRFYPLFQQAYEELGYPDKYFNDRLVEVIDHLLDTPEPAGPILLTQPKVLYEFADPELEKRSAGQKAMLRLGLANEKRVKAKLREIRAAISR